MPAFQEAQRSVLAVGQHYDSSIYRLGFRPGSLLLWPMLEDTLIKAIQDAITFASMTHRNRWLLMFSTRKGRLTVAAFAFAVLLLVSSLCILPTWLFGWFGTASPGELVHFSGRYNTFAIDYPANWDLSETPQGNHGDQEAIAEGVNLPQSWPSIVIAKRMFPKGDLLQVAAWGAARAKAYNKYASLSLDTLSTPNLNGVLRTYTWMSPATVIADSRVIQCEDWYVLRGESGYAVSLCAEKSDWTKVEPVFRQIIESFAVS